MDIYNAIKDEQFLDSIVKRCSGIYILYNGKTLKINHSKNINYEKDKERGYRLVAFCGNKKECNPLIRQFEIIRQIYKFLIDKKLHLQQDEFLPEENTLKDIEQIVIYGKSYRTEFIYCINYFVPVMLCDRISIQHPDIGEIVYDKFRCPELLRERICSNYTNGYYDYSGRDTDCAYISKDFRYILRKTNFGFQNLMEKDKCSYLKYLLY